MNTCVFIIYCGIAIGPLAVVTVFVQSKFAQIGLQTVK